MITKNTLHIFQKIGQFVCKGLGVGLTCNFCTFFFFFFGIKGKTCNYQFIKEKQLVHADKIKGEGRSNSNTCSTDGSKSTSQPKNQVK